MRALSLRSYLGFRDSGTGLEIALIDMLTAFFVDGMGRRAILPDPFCGPLGLNLGLKWVANGCVQATWLLFKNLAGNLCGNSR